jgi:hypothetical protein
MVRVLCGVAVRLCVCAQVADFVKTMSNGKNKKLAERLGTLVVRDLVAFICQQERLRASVCAGEG